VGDVTESVEDELPGGVVIDMNVIVGERRVNASGGARIAIHVAGKRLMLL